MVGSSDPDFNIANGTCFYAANTKARDDYIPCGNIAAGVDWHCCVAGDICLGSQACYHNKFDITYMAGCTDPRFGSPNCPHKGQFAKQQWTGLQRCDPDNSTWAGCKEEGDLPGAKPPSQCKCDPDSELFTDKPELDKIALLPTSQGEAISWFPGMKPTVATKPTTTSMSTTTPMPTTAPKPTTTSMPTSTTKLTPTSPTSISSTSFVSSNFTMSPTTTPPVSSPANATTNAPDLSIGTASAPTLSTAAQIGIGVGAGVGALLIGCLVYLALLLRKRKNMRLSDSFGGGGGGPMSQQQPTLPTFPQPPSYPAPHGHSDAYSTYKYELGADEHKSLGAWNTGTSTVMSRAPSYAQPGPQPTVPLPLAPRPQQFHAYNPTLHGNYVERVQQESEQQQQPQPQRYQQMTKDYSIPNPYAEGASLISPALVSPQSTRTQESEGPRSTDSWTTVMAVSPTVPIAELP